MVQSQYLKHLRRKREAMFSAALKRNGLTSDEVLKSHGKETLDQLRKKYYSGVCRIQNRTRGRQGELIASIALESHGLCKFIDLQRDCVTLPTPFGGRRIDLFYEAEGIAIEAKSGRIYLSKKIRNQIDKDHYLMTQGHITRVIWILCYGASANFHTYAKKRDIEIWELNDVDRKYVADMLTDTQLVTKAGWAESNI